MSERADAGLRAMLAAALLLLGLVLTSSAEEVKRDAFLIIGGEQELLRRAEGRVQRSVLDRLLGPGQGRVSLDKAPAEAASQAFARLAGQPEPGQNLRVSAGVLLESAFASERLALVEKELRETLAGYRFEVAGVAFRLRDDAEQAIEDAQFAVYTGDLDKALARALDAVKADPKSVTALELLGSVYYLQGRKDKARETWSRVLTLDPRNRIVPSFLEKLG